MFPPRPYENPSYAPDSLVVAFYFWLKFFNFFSLNPSKTLGEATSPSLNGCLIGFPRLRNIQYPAVTEFRPQGFDLFYT